LFLSLWYRWPVVICEKWALNVFVCGVCGGGGCHIRHEVDVVTCLQHGGGVSVSEDVLDVQT